MTYLMIDLSNNNFGGDPRKVSSVKWSVLKEDHGAQEVAIKLTEGVTYNDPCAATIRHQAQRAGLRTCFYHFAHGDAPAAEADHFCAHLPYINALDDRCQLDFENPKLPETWAREFNQRVKHNIGVIPGLYSYSALLNALKAKTPIGDGLWIANYGRNDGKEHPVAVPPPWAMIVAHQFTSRATVVGVPFPVDLSHVLRPNVLRLP